MGSLELPEEGSHSHSICSHVMAATCGWVLRRLTQGTKAEDSGTNRRGWSSRKVMLTPFRLYHTKTWRDIQSSSQTLATSMGALALYFSTKKELCWLRMGASWEPWLRHPNLKCPSCASFLSL